MCCVKKLCTWFSELYLLCQVSVARTQFTNFSQPSFFSTSPAFCPTSHLGACMRKTRTATLVSAISSYYLLFNENAYWNDNYCRCHILHRISNYRRNGICFAKWTTDAYCADNGSTGVVCKRYTLWPITQNYICMPIPVKNVQIGSLDLKWNFSAAWGLKSNWCRCILYLTVAQTFLWLGAGWWI